MVQGISYLLVSGICCDSETRRDETSGPGTEPPNPIGRVQ